MPLTRSLDDPVFGGILQDIRLRPALPHRVRRHGHAGLHDQRLPEPGAGPGRREDRLSRLHEAAGKDHRGHAADQRGRGLEVTLTFTLNKPVTTARLAPKTGIALALTVDDQDPNVLTTTAHRLAERAVRAAPGGRPGPAEQDAAAIRDRRAQEPAAEISTGVSGNDVVVSPLEEIDLEAEVSDDYGVTGYGLTYSLVGTESQDVKLDEGEASQTNSRRFATCWRWRTSRPSRTSC